MDKDEKRERDAYLVDLDISNQVQALLRRRFEKEGFNRKAIYEAYTIFTGFKESTAMSDLSNLLTNGLPIKAFSAHSMYPTSKKPRNFVAMNRIAFFYSLMGIEEGDEIISLTQQIAPDFQYPLSEEASGKYDPVLERRRKRLFEERTGILEERARISEEKVRDIENKERDKRSLEAEPFIGAESYSLTTEQARHLDTLARMYTRRNWDSIDSGKASE